MKKHSELKKKINLEFQEPTNNFWDGNTPIKIIPADKFERVKVEVRDMTIDVEMKKMIGQRSDRYAKFR